MTPFAPNTPGSEQTETDSTVIKSGQNGVVSTAADALVIDDDPAIREALERGLRLEGFSVRTAGGGHEALARLDEQNPDVVILDISMPDISGIEVLKRLRADGVDVPVCILSARAEINERVEGLQAGADDYLVKPFALPELVARLHALLRRAPTSPAVPLHIGDLRIDPLRHRADMNGRELDLTCREFELLETLARHAGIVLTRAQLLQLVWGYDFEVDGNVVDVFVGYLRRKLEVDGEPRMLQTVRGVGFVLRSQS
jgi:two-component system, OmpR family, response regulator PrrA